MNDKHKAFYLQKFQRSTSNASFCIRWEQDHGNNSPSNYRGPPRDWHFCNVAKSPSSEAHTPVACVIQLSPPQYPTQRGAFLRWCACMVASMSLGVMETHTHGSQLDSKKRDPLGLELSKQINKWFQSNPIDKNYTSGESQVRFLQYQSQSQIGLLQYQY